MAIRRISNGSWRRNVWILPPYHCSNWYLKFIIDLCGSFFVKIPNKKKSRGRGLWKWSSLSPDIIGTRLTPKWSPMTKQKFLLLSLLRGIVAFCSPLQTIRSSNFKKDACNFHHFSDDHRNLWKVVSHYLKRDLVKSWGAFIMSYAYNKSHAEIHTKIIGKQTILQ